MFQGITDRRFISALLLAGGAWAPLAANAAEVTFNFSTTVGEYSSAELEPAGVFEAAGIGVGTGVSGYFSYDDGEAAAAFQTTNSEIGRAENVASFSIEFSNGLAISTDEADIFVNSSSGVDAFTVYADSNQDDMMFDGLLFDLGIFVNIVFFDLSGSVYPSLAFPTSFEPQSFEGAGLAISGSTEYENLDQISAAIPLLGGREPSIVPLPASAWMLLAGFAMLSGFAGRRTKI